MARIVAVSWSDFSVRYVLAASRGGKLSVEKAVTLPLTPGEPDDVLADAFANEKLSGVTTLISVERASVEISHFTLPPADDSELPELVANQAIRESLTASEDSPLDFVAMQAEPGQPREVTALALAPADFDRIKATCARAKLTPSRLLYRPYAAASLFHRTAATTEGCCLLVNIIDDEVDLSVVERGEVLFSRTTRLPAPVTAPEDYRKIFAEIPRSLLAFPENQPGSKSVTSVYVFGRAGDHQPLIDQIADELTLKVQTYDPFEAAGAVAADVGDEPGCFTALLGMLLDEAQQHRHAIDFLHPRKQPKPPNRKRTLIAGGGMLALVLLIAAYYVWDEVSTAKQENDGLRAQLNELEETLERAGEKERVAAAMGEWQSGEVVWLDELRDLSLKFPSNRDAVVLRMSMAASRGGGGTLTLRGVARHPTVIDQMERQVRDEFREVRVPRIQERRKENAYNWHFETSVLVSKRGRTQYGGQQDLGDNANVAAATDANSPEVADDAAASQQQPR